MKPRVIGPYVSNYATKVTYFKKLIIYLSSKSVMQIISDMKMFHLLLRKDQELY